MLSFRVIPSLLLSRGELVKTRKFTGSSYVGDPINVMRIFNEKEVDELLVLDISATKDGSGPNFELIQQCTSECFMPLAYGGGISTFNQAERLFSLGVEKVCIQTAALGSTHFISELASRFGSQSIMVSIDVKKSIFGKYKLYNKNIDLRGRDEWINVIKTLSDAGAGEILLNAVDRDGTLSGPDLVLVRQASLAVNIPVIALGGVSSLDDIKACVEAGASAVAAGAFFVYHGPHRAVLITYPSYESLVQLFKID